jgi:flagellar protein FlaI
MNLPDLPFQSDSDDTPEDTEVINADMEPLEKKSLGESIGKTLDSLIDTNTINVKEDIDENDFFTLEDGERSTITTRYDMERQISPDKKKHFEEIDRYWVNKPYSFISLFRSNRENEVKYYVIEPYLTDVEQELLEFLEPKIRSKIKYDDSDAISVGGAESEKKSVVEKVTKETLSEYKLYELKEDELRDDSLLDRIISRVVRSKEAGRELNIKARPEDSINAEEIDQVSEYQLEKLLYYLKRDYIGYQKIDPIKSDINVEDISCDGYNSPVFVYHGDHEQIITNVIHGKDSLDRFVINLAKRSGKSISKRSPQVDITLPDGSRGQLTYGDEVSDHGTNYTIRQFKDVPFTPIDLINWRTFSLEQIAFLWLCIENDKSLIFAGGTASGKTTSLNAVSLFIPSSSKIVSIEDTREVELPQRNWVASVTRPSFTGDGAGDVDEFALLEAALRQRPEYIVMGEVRGEEGRTLFQVMSTGHTSYSTFHADSVGEVLKRFTTDPINVSKTMFTALDLVSVQTQTRVEGDKVRRNKSISEVVQYDSENDEIVVQDVYRWQAETDSFLRPGNSNLIEEIKFDRGWTEDELQREINERKVILSYLIVQGLNKYRQVAATFQAYMTDKQTVLTLIAENRLEESLNNLREMESVEIDVDPEDEERTPRPNPDEDLNELCHNILEENKEWLEEYVGLDVSIEESLSTHHPQTDNSEIDTEDIKAIAGETLETDVEDSSIDDILEEIDQRKPDEQKFEVVDQKENSDE